MRIAIDMQGLQSTGSKHRGIGRYTRALTQAILRNRGDHEIFLILNGLLTDTIEPIRASFKTLIPEENIRIWYAVGPVNRLEEGNAWRRHSAELTREAFLTSLKPDWVLITSLFEGVDDDVVSSIGRFNQSFPTAVILYDLIPMLHREIYLGNSILSSWYDNKLEHLRRADLLLAISESSRQEAIENIEYSSEHCINISSAVDEQFKVLAIDKTCEKNIRKRYGLKHPFIMYTGGIDHRKNIEGLIRAYAQLPKSLRVSHQLAIVCSTNPVNKKALVKVAEQAGLKPQELVMTGFVPDKDLVILYNLCKAFVFPSWHEGFGLPALEAMSCGRAVIASNSSSLPEVIGRQDALFNPLDDKDISKKLYHLLTDDNFRATLEKHGLEQAKKFSWDATAVKAIDAMEFFHEKNNHSITSSTLLRESTLKPKLAYVSPLPPSRSGISYYSADLLPELSNYYDIEVIIAQDMVLDELSDISVKVHHVNWFRKNHLGYDRVLYHIGNSDHHQYMFDLLDEIPGIVVLHDFYLSGILAHLDCSGEYPNIWAKSLYYSHGYSAMQQRYNTPDLTEVISQYPCNLRVLQNALDIIVHSDYAKRLGSHWYGQQNTLDWNVIPLLRTAPNNTITRTIARSQLKLNEDDFIICSFGFLSPNKLNHALIHAWLKSKMAQQSHCILVFVGENDPGQYGEELRTIIAEHQMEHRIKITGWSDMATYQYYLSAADLGVQLRTQSRGETSAAVLDCMNYGLATIVNAQGSMVDLPDDSVWKLPDEFDEAELIEALETLYSEPKKRQDISSKAKDTINMYHTPNHCAALYVDAIETSYKKSAHNFLALSREINTLTPPKADKLPLIYLAQALAKSIPPKMIQRQLLVDISPLINVNASADDLIEEKNELLKLFKEPPEGFRIEPVYALLNHQYRYARHFSFNCLYCPEIGLNDDPIDFFVGDVFIKLDELKKTNDKNLPLINEILQPTALNLTS